MTVTYTFINGTVADADEVNQNFTDVTGSAEAHAHDGVDSKATPYTIFGDGSDGALTVTSGTTNISLGVKQYSSITISAGATLSTTDSNASEPLILLCLGSVIIDGTIDLKGKGKNGHAGQTSTSSNGASGVSVTDNITTAGAGGAFGYTNECSGGGGGAGASNGGAGERSNNNLSIPAGGTGWFSSLDLTAVKLKHNLVYQYHPVSHNGSGGGSGGNYDATSSGSGGNGGVGIIIIAGGTITIGAAGDIDCRGDDGGDSTGDDEAGGGGGGGGGSSSMRCLGTYTNNGSIQVNGGTGGTGAGDDGSAGGGVGGAGNSSALQIKEVLFQ